MVLLSKSQTLLLYCWKWSCYNNYYTPKRCFQQRWIFCSMSNCPYILEHLFIKSQEVLWHNDYTTPSACTLYRSLSYNILIHIHIYIYYIWAHCMSLCRAGYKPISKDVTRVSLLIFWAIDLCLPWYIRKPARITSMMISRHHWWYWWRYIMSYRYDLLRYIKMVITIFLITFHQSHTRLSSDGLTDNEKSRPPIWLPIGLLHGPNMVAALLDC